MKSTLAAQKSSLDERRSLSVRVQESTMIKAMGFSSAVRTPRVFTWASIFWLTSAVGVADCHGVQIQTMPQLPAHCGQNVTLTCDVSSSQKLDIRHFSWVGKNITLCTHENHQAKPELECKTTKEDSSHYSLTLTLINFKPIDMGEYICKLRSAQGVKFNKTTVEVQGCPGNVIPFMNASHARCSYQGVFPGGVVHWFQGEANLTDSCITTQEMDKHGLYNILSLIHVKKGNLKQPYNCSLWMPTLGKYHSWNLLPLVKELGSSGCAAGLKWLCIVLEILMLKLIM